VAGLLLDTHALYWLVRGEFTDDLALVAIVEAQATRSLWVSPISAWELAIAAQKPPHASRPHLGDAAPQAWFREATRVAAARVAGIGQAIARGAAEVATELGHKDPGDCFLIATARVRRIPIVTRDKVMRDVAQDRPGYLSVVEC
jgi:PIN domain nuclease of toxin-antitoxin system